MRQFFLIRLFLVILSDVKRKVTLIGASREYCSNVFRQEHDISIDAGQLCAVGVEGGATCRGDAGAPLMGFNDTDPMEKFWYLAGVTSFGSIPCGDEGIPGVYTRVSYYFDWILTKLQ